MSLSQHKHRSVPCLANEAVLLHRRAVYPKGVGGPGLARYLQDANKEVEVWLQVRRGWSSVADVLQPAGTALSVAVPRHSL
jgi:hypothetical protein